MDVSQYSQQELARLQLGFIVREEPHQTQPNSGTRLSKRKRDLQRGQQQARSEMLDDLGMSS